MTQHNSRSGIFGLLTIGILALTACDNREAANEAAPAANAVTAEAPQQATTDEPATPAESEDALELGGVTETEGLTTAPVEQDEATASQPAQESTEKAEWKYKEGADYRRMATAQGTSSPPDKIEVAEIFWYGCPHCYNFDPILTQWKAGKPEDVSFVRIPVIWNPTNQIHARLMYTAEALGIQDKAHEAIFKAMHQENNTLSTEADMIELFARFGIDEAKFKEAYNSFSVTSAVKRAENLTRRYGIKSVPIIVVNGKYAVEGPNIKTFDDMINVTNELLAREQQELGNP